MVNPIPAFHLAREHRFASEGTEAVDQTYSDEKAKEFLSESYAALEQCSNTLCDICSQITLEKLQKPATRRLCETNLGLGRGKNYATNFDRGYRTFSCWQDLKASAEKGCRLCTLLWRVMSFCEFQLPCDEETSIRLSLGDQQLFMECGPIGEHRLNVGLVVKRGSALLEGAGLKGQLVESDNASDLAFAKVRTWIDICNHQHDECPKNDSPELPTRVIDVGDSDSLAVRLILTGGMHGRYTALSHCWGAVKTLTTTRATIDARKSGMQVSSMPRSFRDAVTVTRKLGIKYLWIDSLCIVQDDLKDWEIESSKMGMVYRNSFLTISAASAANSHEGFLIPRSPHDHLTCDIKMCSDEHNGDHGILTVIWPEQSRGYEIIGTRAWTAQELILSPRVLHYTTADHVQGQMVWECQNSSIQEDGHVEQGFGLYSSSIKRILDLTAAEGAVCELRAGLTIYQQWYHIVRQYVLRDLTHGSDKLPALSGLAKFVQSRVQDKYLAGLWEKDLAAGLLWAPFHVQDLAKPARYRAPSWSWASVDGPIFYDTVLREQGFLPLDMMQQFKLEVIEASIVGTQFNPFGEVSSGFIRVKGLLKSVAFDRTVTKPDRSYCFDEAKSQRTSGRHVFNDLKRYPSIPRIGDLKNRPTPNSRKKKFIRYQERTVMMTKDGKLRDMEIYDMPQLDNHDQELEGAYASFEYRDAESSIQESEVPLFEVFDDIAGRFRFDDGDCPDESSVWCLRIATQANTSEGRYQIRPHGLALMATGNEQEYRRVGVFELHRGFLDWFDDCLEDTIIKIV